MNQETCMKSKQTKQKWDNPRIFSVKKQTKKDIWCSNNISPCGRKKSGERPQQKWNQKSRPECLQTNRAQRYFGNLHLGNKQTEEESTLMTFHRECIVIKKSSPGDAPTGTWDEEVGWPSSETGDRKRSSSGVTPQEKETRRGAT